MLARTSSLSLLPLLLCGCIGVSVGTDSDELVEVRGLGTAYAAFPGIDAYDGKILKIGLFRFGRHGGEIASVELWPLFSVGVGVVGARAKVLPFDTGVGLLFYRPSPTLRRRHAVEIEVKEAPATEGEAPAGKEAGGDGKHGGESAEPDRG